MTTETNTAFEGFKDAFKNIQNLEVPEAAAANSSRRHA
ncbi:hypothetical protein ABIA07_001423 [Bradyrhizobium yuanmingense]